MFTIVRKEDLLSPHREELFSHPDSAEWTVLIDKKPYITHTHDFRTRMYVAELLTGKGTHIRSVYQPIIDLKEKRVFGFEGLSRFTLAGKGYSPLKVFEDAFEIGLLGELEWACRETVINSFAQPESVLFVNISPNTKHSENFGAGLTARFIENAGLTRDRVVLEITESAKLFDIEEAKEIVLYYKNAGFRLALDDFGMGYNSLGLLFALVDFVDFVKIPRELVHGISKSNLKLDMIRAIRDICFTNGKYIIVEGVEMSEDLEYIVDLGIDLAQGYFFAKPLEPNCLADTHLVERVLDKMITFKNTHTVNNGRKNLKRRIPVIVLDTSMKFRELEKLIHDLLTSSSIILLDTPERPYVLNTLEYLEFISDTVMRDLLHFRSFDQIAAARYQWLKHLDDSLVYPLEAPSVFDLYLFFESSSRDIVVIREGGRPAYYATRDSVYKSMSDMLYFDRVSVNPLTGLPGNRAVEKKIDGMLKSGTPFWVGYVDLDNFKAFNDHYGFASGDVMLKRVGSCMEREIKERFRNDGFVCHIGGDDFVFIVPDTGRKNLEEFVAQFTKRLSDSILSLYSDEDKELGYFEGVDRDDTMKQFPLASVSLAVTSSSDKEDYLAISKQLSHLKRAAKLQQGSAYIID
ncbi:MAG: GGDEF domain-containing protein [Nitrospirota bacterium]